MIGRVRGVALASLLAAALAGCASAPEDPAVAGCRSEANDDPVVHGLMLKGAGSPSFMLDHQTELAQARQDATLACLRRKGLAAPGGVERRRAE